MAKKDSLTALRADYCQLAQTVQKMEKRLDPTPENSDFILRPFEPMLEAYNSAGLIRKWFMTSASITLVILGIVWTGIQIASAKVSVNLP